MPGSAELVNLFRKKAKLQSSEADVHSYLARVVGHQPAVEKVLLESTSCLGHPASQKIQNYKAANCVANPPGNVPAAVQASFLHLDPTHRLRILKPTRLHGWGNEKLRY